jgi:hypothetical protein
VGEIAADEAEVERVIEANGLVLVERLALWDESSSCNRSAEPAIFHPFRRRTMLLPGDRRELPLTGTD